MDLKLSHAGLVLEPHQIFGVRDAVGVRLQVRRGKVWITQDRDGRDLMISEGDGFTLDRPGLALVHALEPAEVAVAEPGAARPWPQRRWWGGAGRWIAWAFGPDAIDRRSKRPWDRYL
jgi:Protein of unknown function (DUF2917)